MATIFNESNIEYTNNSARSPAFSWHTSQNLAKIVQSEQLHFDIRSLDPGKYSYPYHSHRNAEEMIVILSGECTMRTPDGFSKVCQDDVIFFEKRETGAHQLFNHTENSCKYLDIRVKVDIDVCDYPDSGKINILPYKEIFEKNTSVDYYKNEEDVSKKWEDALESIE